MDQQVIFLSISRICKKNIVKNSFCSCFFQEFADLIDATK